MKKTIITMILTLIATIVNAQQQNNETPSEAQAITCAAFGYIGSSVASEPMFAQAMSDMGSMFQDFYTSKLAMRTGNVPTNGQIAARKEVALQDLKVNYEKRHGGVIQQMAVCNEWRGQIADRYARLEIPMEKMTDNDIQKLIGAPPINVPKAQVEKCAPIVPMMFDAWKAGGYMTYGKFREMMKPGAKK